MTALQIQGTHIHAQSSSMVDNDGQEYGTSNGSTWIEREHIKAALRRT
jgi:hypothetical protein